mmetsp:Transcript_1398/g.4437  ORF Transcript_1398/g.4437 Transcript_1398/m.4437 type:complete len:232 (-) Transcript_1398:106-801(-)
MCEEEEVASRVTETVVHDDAEPAACIPPEEAAEKSAALTAGAARPAANYGDEGMPIYLLRYRRNPKEFEECLHNGPELEPIRFFMEHRGCKCKWASASIFVHPRQWMSVVEIVHGVELRPYHVIVSATYLPYVEQAARSLRSRADVRLRGNPNFVGLVNEPRGVNLQPADVEGERLIEVQNTFIHVSGPETTLRRPTSATRFGTEVAVRTEGAANPRRRAASDVQERAYFD